MAFNYSKYAHEMFEKLGCKVRHSTTSDEQIVTEVIDIPTKQIYVKHTAEKGTDASEATDQALHIAETAEKPRTAGQKASVSNKEVELEAEVARLKAQLAMAAASSQAAPAGERATSSRKVATSTT
jgi:beta-glucosidase/6-phospho-beta-glucosidase/beta-galactosidase